MKARGEVFANVKGAHAAGKDGQGRRADEAAGPGRAPRGVARPAPPRHEAARERGNRQAFSSLC